MASIFSALDIEAYDRQYTDAQLLRRIATYLGSQSRRVIGVALLTTTVALIDVVQPFVAVRGVNALDSQPTLAFILGLVAIILFTRVFSWVLNYFRRRLTARAIGDLVLSLRRDAFRAAVNHDLSFYDEFKTGRIVSRITSDTQEFAQVVTLVTDLISQVLMVIILSAILFTIEWKLTLMLIGFTPVVLVLARAFAAWRATSRGRAIGRWRNVNAAIHETVAGISVAKNFRQERTITTIHGRQRAIVSHQPAARLCVVQCLPDPQRADRGRRRDAGLLRRAGGGAGR